MAQSSSTTSDGMPGTFLANCYCRIIALESTRQILEHLDNCHLPCMGTVQVHFASHQRQLLLRLLLPAWPYRSVITQAATCSFPLFVAGKVHSVPWECGSCVSVCVGVMQWLLLGCLAACAAIFQKKKKFNCIYNSIFVISIADTDSLRGKWGLTDRGILHQEKNKAKENVGLI